MIYTNLSTINKTEPAGSSPDLAEAYGSMGVAAGLIPLHGVRRKGIWATASKVGKDLIDLPSMAYATMVESVYWMGVAKWEKVRELLDRAIDMYRRLGNSSRLGSTFRF